MARSKSAWPRVWRRLLGPVHLTALCRALVGYWEFHVRYFQVEALLLPPPSHVVVAFWNGMAGGLFLKHFGITVYRALSGFALADRVSASRSAR